METSQFGLIDTHCHLYSPEFNQDRQDMMERAFHSGVQMMMLPNIDSESIDPMMLLVKQFPGQCLPMMGLHPCSVQENYQEILDGMKEQLFAGDFAGVGETGVDLYWDTAHKDLQIDAFEQQIRWGKQMNLPVIIHSRESLDLNIEIIQGQKSDALKGIFHCFSGDIQQALRIYNLGFKIGIGGVVTYKNSGLDSLLPKVPKEMIVLETDAPYLAPVPHRGKRNEPAFIQVIAQKVADILNLSIGEVASLTSASALEVFGKKE